MILKLILDNQYMTYFSINQSINSYTFTFDRIVHVLPVFTRVILVGIV